MAESGELALPTLILRCGPMWWSQQLVTEKTPPRSDPELPGMRLGDRYRKRLASLETRSWKACHRDWSQWKCRGAVACPGGRGEVGTQIRTCCYLVSDSGPGACWVGWDWKDRLISASIIQIHISQDHSGIHLGCLLYQPVSVSHSPALVGSIQKWKAKKQCDRDISNCFLYYRMRSILRSLYV